MATSPPTARESARLRQQRYRAGLSPEQRLAASLRAAELLRRRRSHHVAAGSSVRRSRSASPPPSPAPPTARRRVASQVPPPSASLGCCILCGRASTALPRPQLLRNVHPWVRRRESRTHSHQTLFPALCGHPPSQPLLLCPPCALYVAPGLACEHDKYTWAARAALLLWTRAALPVFISMELAITWVGAACPSGFAHCAGIAFELDPRVPEVITRDYLLSIHDHLPHLLPAKWWTLEHVPFHVRTPQSLAQAATQCRVVVDSMCLHCGGAMRLGDAAYVDLAAVESWRSWCNGEVSCSIDEIRERMLGDRFRRRSAMTVIAQWHLGQLFARRFMLHAHVAASPDGVSLAVVVCAHCARGPPGSYVASHGIKLHPLSLRILAPPQRPHELLAYGPPLAVDYGHLAPIVLVQPAALPLQIRVSPSSVSGERFAITYFRSPTSACGGTYRGLGSSIVMSSTTESMDAAFHDPNSFSGNVSPEPTVPKPMIAILAIGKIPLFLHSVYAL